MKTSKISGFPKLSGARGKHLPVLTRYVHITFLIWFVASSGNNFSCYWGKEISSYSEQDRDRGMEYREIPHEFTFILESENSLKLFLLT